MTTKAERMGDKSVEKFEKIISYLKTDYFQEVELELNTIENCGYCQESRMIVDKGNRIESDRSLCPVTRLPREYFVDYQDAFYSLLALI